MSFKIPIPKILILAILLSFTGAHLYAQKYEVEYHFADKDTNLHKELSFLQTGFETKEASQKYINKLPETLVSRGYASASVDSVRADSTTTSVFLFAGKKYNWRLLTDSLPVAVMAALNLNKKSFEGKSLQYEQLKQLERGILDYYGNTGYPFARVYWESTVKDDSIFTVIKADRRVLYHIDSIRNQGTAKINQSFLKRYLNIYNGDIYDSRKLSQINQLLGNLPYLQQQQPWDMMMLGTGGTLDLYLQPKKSSEVNAIVGFLPSDNTLGGKTKITADVRLNLKNALGGGETIALNWQQIEAQSPKLDLGFSQPYLFGTPYGIDLAFGLQKKDSSWLQLNSRLGIQYMWSATKMVSIFYQIRNNYLLQGGLDTASVIFTKKLPPYMDVKSGSVGLSYQFDNLDYRFNPRKGFDVSLTGSAGIRKVLQNNDILKLKDPLQPDFDFKSLYDTIQPKTYLLSLIAAVSHYSSAGRSSVLKFAFTSGWMFSPQLFQNELFRIGGYRLLRGFDEESIYVDRYGVLSSEYRLLTGVNSFLFGFVDLGLTHAGQKDRSLSNAFASTGLGLELETGFGLLNVSYAIGKRNDVKFDLRNASKIHFGYINYF